MHVNELIDIRTFCLMIYYTGCRLSEALEVTPDRLDFDGRRVLIRTLKQNPDKADKYRLIELPNEYLANLESQYKARWSYFLRLLISFSL